MTAAEILSIIADVAAIATAVLAAAFFFGLKWEDREQRNRLAA